LRGRGTYKIVQRFIQALDKNGIDFGFESTFTAAHLESGITLNTMMDFFTDTLNCSELHIPAVALDPEHSLAIDGVSEREAYRSAVEYSTENLLCGKASSISFATRLMDAYTESRPIPLYCPAGFSTLSADAQGNVFTCFMFTGLDDFRLGNVYDPEFPDRSKIKSINRQLKENEKSKDADCLSCWASPFCSGCIGADYFKNRGELKKTNCEVMKSMIEGFLTKIATSQEENKERIKRKIQEKGGDLIGEAMC
jgi:radical SAM protein with 4Fe4S-binding SPASM domain